jgi:hypothetical protein
LHKEIFGKRERVGGEEEQEEVRANAKGINFSSEATTSPMIAQKQKVSSFNGIKRVASKDATSSSNAATSSVLLAAPRRAEGALMTCSAQNEDSATQGEYSPSQGARLTSSTILAEQDSVDFAHKVGEYLRTGKNEVFLL